MTQNRVFVIIPALNEELSISKVIEDIPSNYVHEVIVVDNGSTDDTSTKARSSGATVLNAEVKGYGSACLTGIKHVNSKSTNLNDIVVFIDGDYADDPKQIPIFVDIIENNNIPFVIGSRPLGNPDKGSLTVAQRWGNWLATSLIKLFYNVKFTDLGPFRAIRLDVLNSLQMKDMNFGWTVEMQVKIAKMNILFEEIPITYRNRIGKSKVSGTVRGTISAGYKIIYTIFKYLKE